MNYFYDPAADQTFALLVMMGAALTCIAFFVSSTLLVKAMLCRVPDDPKATQERLHRHGIARSRRLQAERRRRSALIESPSVGIGRSEAASVQQLDLIQA